MRKLGTTHSGLSCTYEMGNWESKTILQYRKVRGPQKALKSEGRWGPRWLHRLIYRMAVNCGMVGNLVNLKYHDTTRFHEVQFNDRMLLASIRQAIDNYNSLELWDLPAIYMGPDCFEETLKHLHGNLHFNVPMERDQLYPNGVRAIIYEVPVIVTPCISGLVVVPYPGDTPNITPEFTLPQNAVIVNGRIYPT